MAKRRFGLDNREAWWGEPIPDPEHKGPGSWRWPIIAVGFLLPFLVPVARSLLAGPEVTVEAVLTGVVVGTYSLCYLGFPFVSGRNRRVKLAFGIGMNVLGVLALASTSASGFVLLYGTAVVVFLVPPAWSVIIDLSALAIGAVILLVQGRFLADYGDLITVGSITLAMFFMGNLVRAVRRLERANEEIATLAVANERERLARDLHDLLGHSLTTITVKAGLARRVLESAGDIPRAVEEIREVESLTRSALSDVRATVSANREVSLSAELVGARAALRAAEIDADLPHAVDNVRPEFQPTFGYVLREAVTNVLRHSGAKRVRVRLGDTWLEVEDDGTATDVVAGNGLRGLTERLAAIGGTVRTSVRPGGGLLVRAEVALPAPSPATPAVRAEPAGGLA
ncbi:sensor histidine kinase [Amycolatopsis tolypomycina]|uniref:Two-component system, NarL family, sensor histidine kinase DesK n=1 Tax=Amycolatopsis tolypomycina TaxID=208445 RepID=A0A1H4ZG07_9PSEU|nr:sensor histidine kinase [Amycolatopsis tolypomycina]SED28424.1 two-component system, NarL family, sensor histidine kinase DesK [Amycolatopsis tolypomycina]